VFNEWINIWKSPKSIYFSHWVLGISHSRHCPILAPPLCRCVYANAVGLVDNFLPFYTLNGCLWRSHENIFGVAALLRPQITLKIPAWLKLIEQENADNAPDSLAGKDIAQHLRFSPEELRFGEKFKHLSSRFVIACVIKYSRGGCCMYIRSACGYLPI